MNFLCSFDNFDSSCIPKDTQESNCEQVKYVLDGSTIFWAIGHNSGVVAKHTEHCGQEVGMVVPFEDIKGEVPYLIIYILVLDLISLDIIGHERPTYRILITCAG
jgi:hypothetical protein